MHRKSFLAFSLLFPLALTACGGRGVRSRDHSMGGAIQGKTLKLATAVSTLADNGTAGFADNPNGMLAEFSAP